MIPPITDDDENESPISDPTTVGDLQQLIADNFMVYFKAHTYHLNVTGPNFAQYHALFEEVYDLLWEWHDTLSENLRQTGNPFPFSLSALVKAASVDDVKPKTDLKSMFTSLDKDFDSLLALAKDIYEDCKDPALETSLGDYCKAIQKLDWKIDATIGKP